MDDQLKSKILTLLDQHRIMTVATRSMLFHVEDRLQIQLLASA